MFRKNSSRNTLKRHKLKNKFNLLPPQSNRNSTIPPMPRPPAGASSFSPLQPSPTLHLRAKSQAQYLIEFLKTAVNKFAIHRHTTDLDSATCLFFKHLFYLPSQTSELRTFPPKKIPSQFKTARGL